MASRDGRRQIDEAHPRYILREPHIPGCIAMRNVERGIWDSPWHNPGEIEHLDVLGRRTRYSFGPRRWIVLTCNTIRGDLPGHNCDARLLIREDYVLREAPNG